MAGISIPIALPPRHQLATHPSPDGNLTEIVGVGTRLLNLGGEIRNTTEAVIVNDGTSVLSPHAPSVEVSAVPLRGAACGFAPALALLAARRRTIRQQRDDETEREWLARDRATVCQTSPGLT